MPLPSEPYDVAIVGAGAAGLAAAIALRRSAAGASIVALDAARRPGAKILVSGGGRCNVTNAIVTERDFWGGPRTVVRRVLRAFPVDETLALFRDLGVPLHEEADGKIFPDANRARVVLDALLRAAADGDIAIVGGRRVRSVERAADDNFRVVAADGTFTSRSVVLATGGQSLPKSGSDGSGFALAAALGHTIVPTTPALVPLVLDEDHSIHRELQGVSQDVELALRVDNALAIRLRGAMLWTHFGASGPVILNMSRHWLRARLEERRASVSANMCPGRGFDAVDREWQAAALRKPRLTLIAALSTLVPSSAARAIARHLGIDGATTLAHVARDDRRRLVAALVEWPLPVTDSRGYTYAEATAGGVALTEIDPATMESRLCPGLWIVGEVLDVDGRIGGFNFQWAWSSGFVAGRAIAKRLGTRRAPRSG